AYAMLSQAMEDAKPYWRATHPELGILEGALGLLAYRAGRYDEAETCTRNAVVAVERLLGPDHPEVGVLSRQLSAILKKQKKRDESKEFEARARQILGRAAQPGPQVSAWGFREVN